MTLNRRNLLVQSTTALGAGLFITSGQVLASHQPHSTAESIVIATWPFGLEACREAHRTILQAGKTAMDAVEAGIRITEADLSNRFVGIGGHPNADGVLQLDACVMDGQRPRQRTGAVACLEGYKHPISVARLVMEKTPHALLVGHDAGKFAKQHGCETAITPCEEAKREWEQWKREQSKKANPQPTLQGHDTITMLALAPDGNLAGGCSTSGLMYKMPGRVGDSPIIGSGLYVDNQVGAAGATGTGENILRYCGSFLAVEFMRNGASPEEALTQVIRRIVDGEQRSPEELAINFLALDKKGRYAAVGTSPDFVLSIVTPKSEQRIPATRIS